MRGHPGPKLAVSAKAWPGPIRSVPGVRSGTSVILAPWVRWLLFQVGKHPLAFNVYARTWISSGAESPWALLFHIGTAMHFPRSASHGSTAW